MIKEVIHDPVILGVKSGNATREDFQMAKDLLDTLMVKLWVMVLEKFQAMQP